MPIKTLNPYDLEQDEDWEGNNAAFRCPVYQKVFIVSDTPCETLTDGYPTP